MEAVPDESQKRTANGLNKVTTERHNNEVAQYQPPHFVVDTETVWWVTELIQPNRGIVYQHRKTLRPMIIMCYEPGTLDDNAELIYFVFTPTVKDDEQGFAVFEKNASVAAEEVPKYLTMLDEVFVNGMGALDPDLSEPYRLAFMQMIGLVVAPLPERREVKAKRKLRSKWALQTLTMNKTHGFVAL